MNYMIYLISAFALFYIYLSYRRLDWAVMFLIAALPSYLIRFSIFGVPSTVLEVMILIVFTVWFFNNVSEIATKIRKKFSGQTIIGLSDYPFKWEIILLLVISLVSAGVGGFSNSAFGIWKAYFFEPILLYIVLFNVLGEKKVNIEKLILWPLSVSALAVSLLAVYQKLTGQLIGNPMWAAESTRRVVSFFGYPNAVGLYLAPLILLFVGWMTRKLKITNYKLRIEDFLIIMTIILSSLSVIFAKSVGASLGVVAGLCVFGFFANKKSRMATLIITIITVTGILFFSSARQTAYKYLTLNDFSGQVRKSQWIETWKMLKDGRIIPGAGLANYQKTVAPYHVEGIWIKDIFDKDWLQKIRASAEFRQKNWQPLEIYLYPHNIFLNFWTELGLVGMLLFAWMIGKYFYIAVKLFQEYDYLTLGLIGAMVAIVVQGLVDVPYFKNDLSALFWVVIAILGVTNLENKSST